MNYSLHWSNRLTCNRRMRDTSHEKEFIDKQQQEEEATKGKKKKRYLSVFKDVEIRYPPCPPRVVMILQGYRVDKKQTRRRFLPRHPFGCPVNQKRSRRAKRRGVQHARENSCATERRKISLYQMMKACLAWIEEWGEQTPEYLCVKMYVCLGTHVYVDLCRYTVRTGLRSPRRKTLKHTEAFLQRGRSIDWARPD